MTPLLFDPGARAGNTAPTWIGAARSSRPSPEGGSGEVFKTRIFEPRLAFTDTTFELTDAMRRKLAGIHARNADGSLTPMDFDALAGQSGNPHGRPRALRHDRRLHALHPDVAE